MTDLRSKRLLTLERHASSGGSHSAVLTLEAIEALTTDNRRPPTLRELCRVRGLTMGAIQDHVVLLTKSGLLLPKGKGEARSLRVAVLESDWVEAGRKVIPRERSKEIEDIQGAVSLLVFDVLNRIDLLGSEIEIVIRHKP